MGLESEVEDKPERELFSLDVLTQEEKARYEKLHEQEIQRLKMKFAYYLVDDVYSYARTQAENGAHLQLIGFIPGQTYKYVEKYLSLKFFKNS